VAEYSDNKESFRTEVEAWVNPTPLDGSIVGTSFRR
jgi:hypothetical protein